MTNELNGDFPGLFSELRIATFYFSVEIINPKIKKNMWLIAC